MTTAAKQLLDQALTLDLDHRAELIDRLSATIDQGNDPEYTTAWEAEIKARVEECERGEVKGVPWREVIDTLGRNKSNA